MAIVTQSISPQVIYLSLIVLYIATTVGEYFHVSPPGTSNSILLFLLGHGISVVSNSQGASAALSTNTQGKTQ